MDSNMFGTASNVYMLMRFFVEMASTIMFTTYALYYINTLGLDPLQLLLVGTVCEVTILLFESVTGVVADTYGRRRSVIIGTFVLGFAFALEGSLPLLEGVLSSLSLSLFIGLLIAEAIRGFGETFLSGATSAWVTDEVGEEQVGHVFLRASQVALWAKPVGIVASVVLFDTASYLPYLVGGVLYLVLAILLVILMKERNFTPSRTAGGNPLRDMAETWKGGVRLVRGHSILMLLLFVSLFSGAASEGFDRLWDAHLILDYAFPTWLSLSQATWFGIISAIATVLSMIALAFASRTFQMESMRFVASRLWVLTALRILLIIAFALAPNFLWALVSFLGLCVIGTLTGPLYDTWLNNNVESRVRATVLSMMSQSNALGQTVGGPLVGAIGTRYAIRTSLLAAAALLLPLLVVFRKARHTKSD